MIQSGKVVLLAHVSHLDEGRVQKAATHELLVHGLHFPRGVGKDMRQRIFGGADVDDGRADLHQSNEDADDESSYTMSSQAALLVV